MINNIKPKAIQCSMSNNTISTGSKTLTNWGTAPNITFTQFGGGSHFSGYLVC